MKSVDDAAKRFPVVTLTGPRQSGKTTLARTTFPAKTYVSLEAPDTREAATTDPRRFLAGFPQGAILDEVQRAPDLLSYLQVLVDEEPDARGRWILTGSQNFALLARVSQSLAGRTALFTLLPFDLGEWKRIGAATARLDETLFAGFFPRIHDAGLAPREWLVTYVATYLERDVRQILNVTDLTSFQTFLRLCAGRSGQLLNVASLASDAGISHATAKSWLSVLEASYVLFRLPPWFRNVNKRLIRTPKLYFHDTGLLCFLLGIQDAGQVATHPLRGAIFETFAVGEILKQRVHRGQLPDLYFYRDRRGVEVDLLVDLGPTLLAVECKAGMTVHGDLLRGLGVFASLCTDRRPEVTRLESFLVYAGDDTSIRQEVHITAWRDLDRVPWVPDPDK